MLQLLVFVLLVAACSSKTVDLSHDFQENVTVYIGDFKPFKLSNRLNDEWPVPAGKVWVSMEEYGAHSHGGTHMDAPNHVTVSEAVMSTRWTVSEIPVERLMGPLRVINVETQAAVNPNYALTVSDITRHEKLYGRIPNGAIVMMNSGWGKLYPNPATFLNQGYPGFSSAAAKYLVENRDVVGVGVDTASLDTADTQDLGAHTMILGANIYGLEMVANLDTVPEAGALVIASPIKSKGASGGPCRVLAVWGEGSYLSHGKGLRGSVSVLAMEGLVMWVVLRAFL